MLLGEVNLAPHQQREFFGDEDGDELQLVLSFTVNQAMFLALAREDATPLARALEALPPIPEDCQWANFVRNHDELTLDKLSEDERQEVFAAFGPEEELQLYGRGLRRRLPTMVGRRRAAHPDGVLARLLAARHAGALLRRGDRDGREPRDRGPLQRARADAVVRRAAGRIHHRRRGRAGRWSRTGRSGIREVNVTRQRRDPQSLLNWMERLIRRRRECPELGWGEWALLEPGDAAVFAQRSDWEGSTVVAVHNFAGRDARARLVLGGEGALVDLFQDEEHELEGGEVTLELPPYGARWFRVRRPGQRLPP